MDAIDGTDHGASRRIGPPSSLLTIILDTNPYAWAHCEDQLPLSRVVASLLVFINAHLAINHANQVTIIASHTTCAKWLYPTPTSCRTNGMRTSGKDRLGVNGSGKQSEFDQGPSADAANKYRPFQQVEQELLENLTMLMSDTQPSQIQGRMDTMIAGAITMALAYIAKQTLLKLPSETSSTSGFDHLQLDPNLPSSADTHGSVRSGMTFSSRILILSVSGDLAAQYIPVMNSIFAAQRQRVPIDVLKLAGDTVFLQQACDSTGGIYLDPSDYDYPPPRHENSNAQAGKNSGINHQNPSTRNLQGIILYLLQSLLPDYHARRALVPPADPAVDFRAACFCHRRIIDVGYVCSVCLSIFCEPPQANVCLTCGTSLLLSPNIGIVPAVLPRVRKKKKKKVGLAPDTVLTPARLSSPAAAPG